MLHRPLLREGPVPAGFDAGAACEFRLVVQPGYDLRAAHLQGPISIMHAWTTSFPW
ncbi:MAG TPA: hypothetical protein VK217_03490 [Acidimicrobiales bacterium]|nr:hypothetical protein [Acidimicrobiales bacterium]